MFALLFKCLDLLLLLPHGDAESQGYNHSNEESHTHLFICSSICLTRLENLQVNSLTSILDLEAAVEQHGQVVASVTMLYAAFLSKKIQKKNIQMTEACIQNKGLC